MGDPSLRLKNGSARDDTALKMALFKLSHYQSAMRPAIRAGWALADAAENGTRVPQAKELLLLNRGRNDF
jgi:hypothetical protein